MNNITLNTRPDGVLGNVDRLFFGLDGIQKKSTPMDLGGLISPLTPVINKYLGGIWLGCFAPWSVYMDIEYRYFLFASDML